MRTTLHRAAKRASSWIRRRTDPDQMAFVSLTPRGPVRGRALLAHVVEPFLQAPESEIPSTHTHFGESLEIAQALLDLGFVVDVISYRNDSFQPRHRYDLLVSARVHFERLARLMHADCIKIVHLDTAHWLSNNAAALQRTLDVQQRRGVTLDSVRLFERTWALECADYGTLKGNAVTYDTYRFAGAPVFRVPNPTVELYASPEDKDFEACRTHFVWLGSRGFVHKGLDVVLEAFSEMPELTLTVCGPLDTDPRFVAAFRHELEACPNITVHGWVDVAAPAFRDLVRQAVGLVYPSCAEGCAGAVVTAMQAGLIPIVTPESGIDVDDTMGVSMPEITVAAVARATRRVAGTPPNTLRRMATKSWTIARETHTRDHYRDVFRCTIEAILGGRHRGQSAFIDAAPPTRLAESLATR